jgi:hypothetical protein
MWEPALRAALVNLPLTVVPAVAPWLFGAKYGGYGFAVIPRGSIASASGPSRERQLLAQSGRSLLTTDKNVARASRFAIKAGIGSKRPR